MPSPAEIRKIQEEREVRVGYRAHKHFRSKDPQAIADVIRRQDDQWQRFMASGIRAGKAAQAEERERLMESAMATARFAEAQRKLPRYVRPFPRPEEK